MQAKKKKMKLTMEGLRQLTKVDLNRVLGMGEMGRWEETDGPSLATGMGTGSDCMPPTTGP